ncbi:MAG: hypothetical protein HN742_31905 [Lentisphaerae bacterium]|jgi:hypothetical protein|nr:hypothetical protein [Lentisphaerota bacterium]MBT5609499.1 hypothetical protein [Lentisphaerota bacterium]MBT7061647.1 hypothetical protein [Lentisphaerota bacterium]MBT7846518.1 hypothetical protein [Lentisphaerota bacterium]
MKNRCILVLFLSPLALLAGEADSLFEKALAGDSGKATFIEVIPRLEALAKASGTEEEKARCVRLLQRARFYAGVAGDPGVLGADSAEDEALHRRIAAGRTRFETLLAARWERQEGRLKEVAERWVTKEGVPRPVADAALQRMQAQFRRKGSVDPSQLEKELLAWALNKLVK